MRLEHAERDKYARMWAVSDYARNSPGEQWMPTFLELVGDQRGTLLDAGCGTGRAGQLLQAKGFDVTLMDFAPTGLEVDGLPFVDGVLWRPIPTTDHGFDFAYCCDVLEHIPPEMTMLTVSNLLDAARYVFLTICTEPDQFGVRIGEPLHLTVQPFTWWRDHFREIADVVDARDCLNTSVFYLRSRW